MKSPVFISLDKAIRTCANRSTANIFLCQLVDEIQIIPTYATLKLMMPTDVFYPHRNWYWYIYICLRQYNQCESPEALGHFPPSQHLLN